MLLCLESTSEPNRLRECDKKAKVLSQPWPQDALPPPYSSLLAVASANGLYAAASPDALVIGKTQDARKRIYDPTGPDVRDCPPLHTIPHSRLAHVAFSADESCLVVAEEKAAEIIAYGTPDLAAANSNIALKLSLIDLEIDAPPIFSNLTSFVEIMTQAL